MDGDQRRKSMGIFEKKTVVITGGASGIGRAVGEELARRGAQVILADMNSVLVRETADSITAAGHRAKAVTLDVTDPDAVKKVVDDTVSEFGRLDYIFNNAGVVVFGGASDFSYEDWRRVIDTDLYGVVNGVFAAFPVMAKQGFGHIISTASIAGLVPIPGAISYVASKFGVVGLSNALRVEGEELGVKVSVVCPGLIDTPMKNSKMINIDNEALLETAPKLMPAEECARVILDGVERNKPIIVVTAMAKIFWALQRICPRFLLWLLSRGHRQALGKIRIQAN
ncbi:MAG: SDR family oxidoreductase [bacterium]|nr:SDR family oxidoreductase [bacterium]